MLHLSFFSPKYNITVINCVYSMASTRTHQLTSSIAHQGMGAQRLSKQQRRRKLGSQLLFLLPLDRWICISVTEGEEKRRVKQ